MTNTAYSQWLREFADRTRAEVLRCFGRPDSCVLSTRIGLEVLRYYGIQAKPQPVNMLAFPTVDGFEAWLNHGDAQAIGYHAAVLGSGTIAEKAGRGRVWDGHLLMDLPTERRLVDLSIDQLDRPERGLRLTEPLISDPYQPGQWQVRKQLVILTPHNCVIVYEAANSTVWRDGTDWTSNSRALRRTVGAIIRALQPPPVPGRDAPQECVASS